MIDAQALDRVLKARAELIVARRFYGVLVSNVEPVISRKVPTAATNGKTHYWNPDFIMKLTPKKVLGVQAHESEHDARHHGTRRNGRDPVRWNEACDYAINIDLKDEGFELPDGALIDERFRGMSAEDIYRIRELDAQRAKQKQEQEQQDAGEPGEDQGDTGEPQGDAGEPGEGEGESGEDQGDTGEPQGDAGEGDAGEPQSCGDPGGCGEVLDSAENASDNAEIDQQWERITRQAVSLAKRVWQLPGHVSRDIERANNPSQDWREVLRAWFDQGALQVETWTRPNRRLIGSGIYIPGKHRDGINKVAFLIDTSGSMDEIALRAIMNETQAALDDGVIDEIVVVYGDTQVTRVDTYRTGDEMAFDPRGGGGTRLLPLFEYIADNVDDAALIVCFTDMEFEGSLKHEHTPHCPVLFAATGYPQMVRHYLANAPWDSPGIDIGEH